MKTRSLLTFNRFALLLAASVFLFWACRLNDTNKVVDHLSFTKLYDSLSAFDSVVIVVKDRDGKLIDSVFNGKVDQLAKIENLEVKGWDGGAILIDITGFKGKEVVYSVQKRFDGKTGKTDTTITLNVPVTVLVNEKIPESLTLSPDTLFLATNGAPGNLVVKSIPSNASKVVTWHIEDPAIASVDTAGLVHGLKNGATKVWATSVEKTTVQDSAWVVISDPLPVESIRFLEDSTSLYIGGAEKILSVLVLPAKANQGVDFSLTDSTRLALKNNRILGLVEGVSSVIVKSKDNPSKTDTLTVKVLANQHIDSLRLNTHTAKLFTGGETYTFIGIVSPSTAPKQIQWKSKNPDIATVDATGKSSPVGPGKTFIYAISLADSLQMDSAEVTVKRDMPQMNVGQDTIISLGQTVAFLPVVAPQEYGLVDEFKWDLDGDLTWDGTSPTVKSTSYKYDLEKEYSVRFYVRDSEGNETIVIKKVKAAKGLVLNITSPANNSYSRVANITLVWKVNETVQDSQNTVTLVEGKNIITRTAKDLAGTAFSTSITVTLDSIAPTPPVMGTVPPAIVNKSDPRISLVWSWSKTGEATDSFVVKMNGAEVARQTGTNYTVNSFMDGLYQLEVVEKDLAGNNSTVTTAVSVLVDRISPDAPSLSTPISPKKTAQWTWTIGTGGNGLYECQLDALPAATCTTPYTLPNPTDGDHTLNVRQVDVAGNLSAWTSTKVTIDLQIPVVKLTNYLTLPTQVINSILPFTGTAVDDRSMRYVQYRVGSGTTNLASGTATWSFTPTLAKGQQILTIIAEDVAGNRDSSSVSITYEPKVIFVRKGLATGSGNGTSWANAFSELGPLLKPDLTYPAGTQFWVSEGTYEPSVQAGFTVHSDVSVYGGFAIEGTDSSLASRNLAINVSMATQFPMTGAYIFVNAKDKSDALGAYSNNIIISDWEIRIGRFPVGFSDVRRGTLNNLTCQYNDSYWSLILSSSTIDITNSRFYGNTTKQGAITSDGYVRILNTRIQNNSVSDGGGGVTLNSGSACAGNGTTISDNSPREIQLYGGTFSRDASVVIGPNGISNGTNTIVSSCPAP
ncbi:MAG: Ig-like domain-containing protein [Fibrobacterota bacterium]|nr:Ig-like domain-containing protein [Fibrobacterota bacterium]